MAVDHALVTNTYIWSREAGFAPVKRLTSEFTFRAMKGAYSRLVFVQTTVTEKTLQGFLLRLVGGVSQADDPCGSLMHMASSNQMQSHRPSKCDTQTNLALDTDDHVH